MTRESRVYEWDTTNIPDGTYYVYGVATDGLNSMTRLATGRIVISHSRAQDTIAPILSVSLPSEGLEVMDVMRVKGYALDSIQVAAVEILVDGDRLGTIHPSLFNKTARDTYPSYSESSNAGFNELISLSSVANGAHVVTVTAYDTGGNATTSTINIVKVAGSNSTPDGGDVAENEVVVPYPTPNPLGVKATIKGNKKTLTVKVTGGASCGLISVVAGATKAIAEDQSTGVATLASKSGGRSTTTFTARGLRPVKAKASGKPTPIYVSATCNGGEASTARKIYPGAISKGRPIKGAAAWLTHAATKLR